MCRTPKLGMPRRCWGVRPMGFLAQLVQMTLSPLLFQITSVCFTLRTRAESTAVSPLFTVCVTLSGSRWAAGWREGVRGHGHACAPLSPACRLTSGVVVHVDDARAPRPRAAHAGEDAHEVGGLGEAAQGDLVRAVAGQVRGLPGPGRAHNAVVLLQQQGSAPGVRAPDRPGLPRHAGQKETLRLREAQVGQQCQVPRCAWGRDISPRI